MEDLYLDEMEAPCRDLVLAVPGRARSSMEHRPVEARHAADMHGLRRLRAVACGFPDRRLRLTLRLAQGRRGG